MMPSSTPRPTVASGSATSRAALDEAHRLLGEALHLARFYNPHLERRIRRFLDTDAPPAGRAASPRPDA